MEVFEPQIFALLISGLVIGVLSSIFGIGGGILIIPILQWLYPEMTPQEWVGTSFGVILMAAIFNSFLFFRQKFELHAKLILFISVGLTSGIIAGQHIVFFLPEILFSSIFAITLIGLGAKRLFGKPKTKIAPSYPPMLHISVGFFIGLISGMIGVGGGSLIIPYLIIATPIPARAMSFHSNLAMICGSLIGVINMSLKKLPLNPDFLALTPYPQWTTGHVHWDLVAIFFLGILSTARLGIALTKRIKPALLDRLFAGLLFAIGLKFLGEIF